MESGINEMTDDGWKMDTTEFIPEKKLSIIALLLTKRWTSRTNPEYYRVIYSREADSRFIGVMGGKGVINAIPRWSIYGVLASTASLIAIGLGSVIDDFWLLSFLGFGFIAPAYFIDDFFIHLDLGSYYPEFNIYYTLMAAVIWFVIGAVTGILMSLPVFDSVPEQHKSYISVAILVGIAVIGIMFSLMMALG
jgi:hypothetical protein